MAKKFKAEVPEELRKELNDFLKNLEMTKSEFLKLAIRAKEHLVINAQQWGMAAPTLLDKFEKRFGNLASPVSKISRKKAGEKKSSQTEKTDADKSNSNKDTASPADEAALASNRALFKQFARIAEKQGKSYTEFAKELGFNIKQVQRIKSEKCPNFIPKLTKALNAFDK